MAKTYIDLANVVLRDLNEVPLTTGNFATARGLQAFVKEALNRSLIDIVNYNDEWPWLTNAALDATSSPQSNTFTTIIDQVQYAIDATASVIDFDTIKLKDPAADNPIQLEHASYDQVVSAVPVDAIIPHTFYITHDKKFIGLYPKPDKVYTITYVSWKSPVLLSVQTDTIPFDERFYNVLVSRTRYYAWQFRGNAQLASIALNEYNEEVKRMFTVLMVPEAPMMRAV